MEFADRATSDIYNGIKSKRARARLSADLVQRALDKLTSSKQRFRSSSSAYRPETVLRR